MTSEVKIEQKQVAGIGTYQICFKSGASSILENAELYATFLGDEPQVWHFRRDGKDISFTAHYSSATGRGEKPLDEVIDAILRLK